MKRFGLCLLLLAGCSASLTSFSAEIRLAIVSTDPRATIAGELLTAEFSRTEFGVAMLERAEVERIRREQNLAARSSADFARLGRALGAQGVLVLDVLEQKEATNLTAKLIAVQPGVALGFQSYSWPLRDVSQWPGIVGKQFAGLLPKLGVLAQDAVALSVLNLRSPLKTGEGQRLETEATTLLIHRLIAQREIFVLERQRMTLLGAEKELKDMQESPFWNGSYLLEGVVERGGATRDTLTINARLVSPERASQTLSVKSDAGDLKALIDQLAREVISRLGKATNAVAWNPAAEAKRYLEEARWGMRWATYPLAQAAADSAWALGEHTLEAALIRVNSHSLTVAHAFPSEGYSQGEYVGPTTPPLPSAIPPLVTALESFAMLTPALGTNALSRQWRRAGEAALEVTAGHLSVFWYFPAETAKLSDDLERWRSAARSVERILLNGEEHLGSRAYGSGIGTNLWQMRLKYGWILTESPEAAVAEFKRLFDVGLSPKQREEFISSKHRWLMPWTERERARAGTVWNSFLTELARSTNTAIALSARLLDIRSPLPSDRALGRVERARREQLAADVMLRHRHELLCSEPELTRQAMGLLDGSVEDSYGQRQLAADRVRTNYLDAILTSGECYDNGMFAWLFRPAGFETNHLSLLLTRMAQGFGTNSPVASRKSFLKSYFAAQRPFHPAVFDHLFRAEDYNAAEALPMLIRLKDWRGRERIDQPQNLSALDRHISSLASIVTPPGVAKNEPLKPPRAAILTPADPNMLTVTNFWRPAFTKSSTHEIVEHCIVQTLAQDHFIWAQVRGRGRFKLQTPEGFGIAEKVFEQFYRIDATDLSSVASPIVWREGPTVLLENRFGPFAGLVVHHGVLYVYEAGKLSSWDPRETKWRQIDVALPGQMRMQAIGERFYFGGKDTLLEFNPANLALRIMASLRRNPPLVPADRLPGYGDPLFVKGNSNTVYVTFEGAVHPWNVVNGTWHESFAGGLPALSKAKLSYEQDSALYAQGQFNEDRKVRRFGSGGADELLFLVKKERFAASIPSRRSAREEQPRWRAPAGLDRMYLTTARDGTNLWALDWAQRSLSYFEGNWQEPAVVRFRTEPKEITNSMPGLWQQIALSPTRDGLVVTPHLSDGFWLIPQKSLEIALANPRREHRTARTNAPAAARTSLPNSTNSDFVWADEAMPDAAKVMRIYQSSQPGSLDMGELISAIRKEPNLAQYQSLIATMHSSLVLMTPYDTNDNGRIDLPELDAMIKLPKPRLTVEEYLERWDTNRNGRLDGAEFRAAVADRNARRTAARAAASPPRTNATVRPRP